MTLTRNKPLLGVVGVALVALAAWLAFGFFGIQAAFLDNEVSETGPVFNASASEQDAVAATDEFQDAMADANENMTEADESMEDAAEAMADTETETETEADDDAAQADAGTEADAETEAGPGDIVTLVQGQFSGESRYTIEGQALVLNDGSEQRFLRFENFSADNGPDLKVYLRAADGNFVDLGPLKGNIGDQNYEIPTDVDLAVFNTVDIWCERFGVGFGTAPLA